MTPPSLTIQLFGTPRVLIDQQPIGPFHSSKVAGLLYYLAADPRPRSRARLAGLLWPDYEATPAKKNLRGALYHLRKALDPYLHVARQEVGLLPGAPVTVDLIAFETALAQARQAEDGTPAQLELLNVAVETYCGPFLEGFTLEESDVYEEWLEMERRRLHELALQALVRLVAAHLDSGDFLRGMDHATRLLRLDPLREETRRDLMLMLALDGQPQAALTHFDEYCAYLDAELGVPPGAELRELATQLRAGDYSQPAVRLPSRLRHNLPAELTPILGREAETAWLLEALRAPEIRLVTIVGVGGTGKTRLALHVGHRIAQELADAAHSEADTGVEHPFADGVFFVDLAGLEASARAEEQIAAAIAAALQLTLDVVDPVSVAAALRTRRLLLLLDNFELLQANGGYLSTLLEQAPDLHLLVTSRVHLKLRGETLLLLEGLAVPETDSDHQSLTFFPAPALFLQRAHLDEADLDERDAAAVVATCHLLHGLPLGIELAAAWAAMLSPRDILTEIERGLDFLQSDMPDLPARHRSLRAVFERTWQQLGQEEQTTLAHLAFFRGGFSRAAAQAVAAASLLTLRKLHDKSLIRLAVVDDDEMAHGGRYEIVEVLRQYAAERLDDSAAIRSMQGRHVRYYIDFLAGLQHELRSGDQPAALDAIGSEIDNIRAAMTWLIQEDDLSTLLHDAPFRAGALALFDFFDTRGWYSEGETLFGQLALVAKTQAPNDEVLATALRARQAWFVWHLGRAEAARVLLEACANELQQLGAENDAVFALNYLGAVSFHAGQFETAQTALRTAARLAAGQDDDFGASLAHNTLGQLALAQGDGDAALASCEQALALKRSLHDRRGMTYALTTLGQVAILDDRHDDARRLFGESLQICEALGDLRGIGLALRNLGDVAADLQEYATAQRMYGRSVEVLRETGSRGEISASLDRLAQAAAIQNRLDDAVPALREALAGALEISSAPAMIDALLTATVVINQLDEQQRSDQLVAALATLNGLSPAQRARLPEISLADPSPSPIMTTDALPEIARRTLGYLESRAH